MSENVSDKITEWLNQPVNHKENSFDEAIQIPRIERIAFLVACNGGFQVHGWGCVGYGGAFRQGLEQQEALELIEYSGVFTGLGLAGIDVAAIIIPKIDGYIKKRVEVYEQNTKIPLG